MSTKLGDQVDRMLEAWREVLRVMGIPEDDKHYNASILDLRQYYWYCGMYQGDTLVRTLTMFPDYLSRKTQEDPKTLLIADMFTNIVRRAESYTMILVLHEDYGTSWALLDSKKEIDTMGDSYVSV